MTGKNVVPKNKSNRKKKSLKTTHINEGFLGPLRAEGNFKRKSGKKKHGAHCACMTDGAAGEG